MAFVGLANAQDQDFLGGGDAGHHGFCLVPVDIDSDQNDLEGVIAETGQESIPEIFSVSVERGDDDCDILRSVERVTGERYGSISPVCKAVDKKSKVLDEAADGRRKKSAF